MSKYVTIGQTMACIPFLLGLAALLAYLEIQIEGKHGWATQLPTWRYNASGFVLTGYHLSLWAFILLILHLPFIFVSWKPSLECFILSFFVLLLLVEDALWFFLNRGFCGKDPWRDPKFATIPIFYFMGGVVVLLLALCSRSLPWMITALILLAAVIASSPFQIQKCTGQLPAYPPPIPLPPPSPPS
jgi:hypothetical protein